jgi:hypothetical protein
MFPHRKTGVVGPLFREYPTISLEQKTVLGIRSNRVRATETS